MVANVSENLVENFHSRLGLLARDDQWRIDPHAWKISYHQKAALERLFEDRLGYGTAEQLLGLAIAHQVKPDQQALAAHVADEFVFLFEPRQALEHKRADDCGIFDQPFALDRAQRLGDRHRR